MQYIVKSLFLVIAALLTTFSSNAQKVSFAGVAPGVVVVGEPFRVEFSLNAKPDGFTPPTFPGFDILAGPTTSSGQSISVVNGSISQTYNFIYTYVIQARTSGKFTISSASVKVDNKNYSSAAIPIEVITAEVTSQQAEGTTTQKSTSATSINADDIIIRAIPNRTNVYKGQHVTVTFKLYTRVPISGIESATYPAFNGFWSQEIGTDNYQWQREALNGKVYDSRIIKETLLYPQQSGKLFIEQLGLTVIAQIITQTPRSQSVFDDLFGGGQSVREVKRPITSQPVQITVKDFPAGAPASFNGAVGKFQLRREFDQSKISANSSYIYTLKLTGNGNLPLIQAPKLALPNSFEQYNIKTTESGNSSSNGISGMRQFDYPFIPRAEGNYTIDPVEFSYFDPEQAKYLTISTEAIHLNVRPDSTGGTDKGMISGVNKEDLKILDKDIRFIDIKNVAFIKKGSLLLWSFSYFGSIIAIIIIFIATYLYFKKRLREMENISMVRHKKANRVALQRLKAAASYMNSGDERQFYEEMLKALWGYMSDKLNIPVSNLTKDNIREELIKRDIANDLIVKFIDIISNCEYAQYSPSSYTHTKEIYTEAAYMLSKFESLIKVKI